MLLKMADNKMYCLCTSPHKRDTTIPDAHASEVCIKAELASNLHQARLACLPLPGTAALRGSNQ